MTRIILFFALICVLGCKEKPYSEQIAAIKKHELSGVILSPAEQSVLNGNSFRDGIGIKASISSTAPLADCGWLIQSEELGEQVLSGEGLIDGGNCRIEGALDSEKLSDGNYFLKLHAEDATGLVLNDVSRNFQVFKEVPNVNVISPNSDDFLKADNIQIFGSLNDARNIKEIQASFHGIGADNQHLKGSAEAEITDTTWKISLGNELLDGEYKLDVVVTDIYGNERVLPSKTIRIDHQPPIILGASDGIPQKPYAQETINYRQRLVGNNGKQLYVIEPVEKPSVINWQKTPTIYRWLPRLDDEDTAPGYTVRVSDDVKLKEVKYSVAQKCSSLEEANKIAAGHEGHYDIRFTQNILDFNLSRNSEKYCLGIWALDNAGNASNHQVHFVWQVLVPPLSIDMNTVGYKAFNREDDISWIGPPVWTIFRGHRNPIELKKNLVVGHAILSNPFSSTMAASVKLKKPMELIINNYQYRIPVDFIDIKYYSYDLLKNEIGTEKTLNDGSTNINNHETLVAKFVLAKELPLRGLENPSSSFWERFSLKVGFSKVGNEYPMVDGLMLITREPNLGVLSNEFKVPWGNEHQIRRRSASRVAM